ncbi:sigma-54-dependent Fis family transcriptional regulator [candidate division KSB1 bacterium]|nr:sigma-54-dependent Fis family transcriptional regulator [candidate division KSB1 bacterium]
MNRDIQQQLPKPGIKHELLQKFGLIGESDGMQQIMAKIEQVAPTNISVLIIGESGTGKEIIARAIHEKSLRKENPLVIVNCGAIPEGILESELFGHEKGSFTGAVGMRKGYFETANGGTIFLDEIGEMPLNTQVKLLRVLEGGEFMRVGGNDTRKVDVRVIAATNRNLEKAVQNGEFRHDLYYRLNAVSIHIPPLRERRSDIRPLVKKFADDFCRQNHIEFKGFTEDAFLLLENYLWQGNIRELKNVIESVIVLEKGNQVDSHQLKHYLKPSAILDRQLPVPTSKSAEQAERELMITVLLDLKNEISQLRELILKHVYPPKRLSGLVSNSHPISYHQAEEVFTDEDDAEINSITQMEQELIQRALEKSGGNKRKAAKLLEISERTLYRKIKEYDLPY